jgi:hypothetical protein
MRRRENCRDDDKIDLRGVAEWENSHRMEHWEACGRAAAPPGSVGQIRALGPDDLAYYAPQ